ncbi:MAG TPA: lysophospholipid acyltransferase family protein [Chitinispirillaceae bacterium]|nr:lysophospholipid acyltransferase family protein [Chitinispirillaceae bacterium]
MDCKNLYLNKIFNQMRISLFILWGLFSTVFYGIGCIVLSLFSRKIARSLGRLWNKHLLMAGGVKVVVKGVEKLDKNKRYVFIANHSSNLDIPVLFSGLEYQISFIAKKELFMIPFFGWGIAAMGHICIDRKNARKARESFTRAIKHLKKEHISLILFPEGTRSVDGTVGEFKRASFTLALEAGVQVVPVAIRNTGRILPKKSFRIRPGTAYLEIFDPIDITPDMKKADLARLVHKTIKSSIEKEP